MYFIYLKIITIAPPSLYKTLYFETIQFRYVGSYFVYLWYYWTIIVIYVFELITSVIIMVGTSHPFSKQTFLFFKNIIIIYIYICCDYHWWGFHFYIIYALKSNKTSCSIANCPILNLYCWDLMIIMTSEPTDSENYNL